ncbi:MAG: hypothetical protein EAZ78_00190 [Oscillatoriales cyanobacterium]|nr:MAG: hypothetical protein EA000_01500 [Oscillatoriales cyanobacterium]TAD96564.1 MAG: hypothetical protein EAZ96_25855 [Oscillatoriales cyanobacterium]TAD99857.1 MAG: hypothetical protein EAZ98_04300 [Oscillatoriales cyanobacterium]TAF07395.1 MAG: hypothetical protein EAZ78_00190 [Oscillatoriales cyanobacterium]TAF69834.1 MAG: hypothetical protein EAZ59_07250 [Oscillatoriales cyanobacterium]
MGAGLFKLFVTFKVLGEPAPTGRAVSFSCRGGAPVPAPISETHTKSWTKRVGTGALPLQNHRFPENETALPLQVLKNVTKCRWGRVYFNCLSPLKFLVNPPLQVLKNVTFP